MFYMKELTKELEVQPRFFGPRLREEIDRRLRMEVEGTCNGQFGFILGVLGIVDMGRGLLREGSGAAVFNITYTCICFKPFKGQVMDVVVTSVNKMGFFAEAGPLQVFVSNHLISEGFEFNTAHEPCYQMSDGDQKIVPGCEVRLRIVGTRVDASDIFAVGSIKEDYLGVMGAPL
ncbi:DNA-directed RNA polymerase II subunit RPB7 [Micractinium conductrix]|uniref:DNA-directed RNA polymerase II subunit RPB7 n=1 Tax=Micractinium conductrix TaxID=554055 RepID=A0A2P6V2J3_9CHLO|nr:DNA-directed RNA polymerase II subunit RPB7 [Micractinium conductrix]|eukprot:PSC68315.1 DNA-directed RNA polymerase II subunit RPB7 [Micractinium conductrix]